MLPSETEPFSEQDIRQAVSRLLASKGFVRSTRLRALLEYLVEESLAGRGEKIKATTVAIEVFGRDENFDQQADPIVRVEAGRLRQRLAEYYREQGEADPVGIDIPSRTSSALIRAASTGSYSCDGGDGMCCTVSTQASSATPASSIFF